MSTRITSETHASITSSPSTPESKEASAAFPKRSNPLPRGALSGLPSGAPTRRNSADKFAVSTGAAPERPAPLSGADLAQYRPKKDAFADKSGYNDGQLSSLIDAHQARPLPSGVMINAADGRPNHAKAAEEIPDSFRQAKPAAISSLTPRLKAGDVAAIQQAHENLINAGYSFAGFHGTNQAGANSMLEHGLHPGKIGSGGGVDKGAGFYLAHQPNYAKDYSAAASEEQSFDEKTGKETITPLPGDAGKPQVMRVYQQHADAARLGDDSAWGVMSVAGDPNHDKNVPKDSQRAAAQSTPEGIAQNRQDLEMVVAPGRFGKTAVIPGLDANGDEVRLGNVGQKWRPHEV